MTAALAAPLDDGRPALNRLIRVPIDSLAFTREVSIEEVTASGLLADIRERGVLNPPLARRTPDGPKWGEIVAGNGRATCLAALGNTHIEVIDLGPLSLADAIKAIALDHTLHREMGSLELFGYVVSYMRATGCKPSEAMQALNVQGPNRTKISTVLGGHPECVQAVLAGEAAASTMYEMMHRVRSLPEQAGWCGKIKAEKLTRQEVIDRLKPKGRKAPKPATRIFEFHDYQPYIAALEAELSRARQAHKNGVSREAFGFELRDRRGK